MLAEEPARQTGTRKTQLQSVVRGERLLQSGPRLPAGRAGASRPRHRHQRRQPGRSPRNGRLARQSELPAPRRGGLHRLAWRHSSSAAGPQVVPVPSISPLWAPTTNGLAVGKPRGRWPALTVSPVDRRTVEASSVNGASAPSSKESNFPKPVPADASSRTRNGHLGLNISPVPSLAQRGLVQAIVGRDALGHFGRRGRHPHSYGPHSTGSAERRHPHPPTPVYPNPIGYESSNGCRGRILIDPRFTDPARRGPVIDDRPPVDACARVRADVGVASSSQITGRCWRVRSGWRRGGWSRRDATAARARPVRSRATASRQAGSCRSRARPPLFNNCAVIGALAEPRGEPVDLPGPAPRVSDIHRICSPVGSPQSAEGGRVIPRRCHRALPRVPSAEQGGGRVDEFRVGGLGAVGSDAGTEERRSFDQHGEDVRPCLANSVGE